MISKDFNSRKVWSNHFDLGFVLYDHKAHSFYDFVQKRKGFLYVIEHPDRVGLLKLGRTSKDPFVRAKTLSTAGILGDFNVLWITEFANASWAEAQVHKSLSVFNEGKEFFRVSLSQAKEVFINLSNKEDKLLEGLQKDILLSKDYESWLSSLDIKEVIDNTY